MQTPLWYGEGGEGVVEWLKLALRFRYNILKRFYPE